MIVLGILTQVLFGKYLYWSCLSRYPWNRIGLWNWPCNTARIIFCASTSLMTVSLVPPCAFLYWVHLTHITFTGTDESLSLSSPLLFTCHQKLCLFDGKHIYEEKGQKMLEKFKKVEICLACNKVLAPNHHGAYSAKRIKVFHNLQWELRSHNYPIKVQNHATELNCL